MALSESTRSKGEVRGGEGDRKRQGGEEYVENNVNAFSEQLRFAIRIVRSQLQERLGT